MKHWKIKQKMAHAAGAERSVSLMKNKSIPWKRILIISAGIFAAILLAFILFIWYLITSAPDINTISVSPVESATYICDQDGNYLRKLTLPAANRDIVTLEEIPADLEQAMIAIEDSRFYEHGGIDIRGILRAFWKGVTSGSFSEGASTITQQLIKNSVFTEWTQENSFLDRFRRKVQEQYLALQLEKRTSKEEILADYLNTINMGAGCYGVQAASRRYFGKDVSDLTLSESAVLAAIPQNPSGNNPILYPQANQKRQVVILNYMHEQGYISDRELADALADDVYSRIHTYDESYEEDTAYTYYEDALIEQAMDVLILELGCTSDQAYRAVYSGGLRIYSAQNQSLQQICDDAFQNPANFPEGTQLGIDYALSVVDENNHVTHYGTEALRSYVRENLNESFNLICTSEEEAQQYTDAFRDYIMEELTGNKDLFEMSAGDSAENATGTNVSESAEKTTSTEDTLTETSVASVLGERLSLSPQPQASLVLIDQQTGCVRAIVGGRGEKTASLTLNRATETTRQPGSTFKILTAYAPALDTHGKTLAALYENEPYKYENGAPVSNWDITDYSGPETIRQAITRSINVIAVKCITEITPQAGFDYAKDFGITTLHESYETANGVSSDVIQPLALGGVTQGVTNLELCNAYAAIANGGIYRTPKFFTRIEDRQGKVIFSYEDINSNNTEDAAASPGSTTTNSYTSRDGHRILTDSTAFLLTDAMEDVVSSPSGTAYGTISAAGQPVAGKTGTTSNYKDIWFVGYTPYYTCCVWGGYDNNQDLPSGSTYHSFNKILWSAVMNQVHASLPAAGFEQPDSVTKVTLCKTSHQLAKENSCPETYAEYFAVGTEPTEECPVHEPEPETEPIYIYPEILDQLITETESDSETESESESNLESEMNSESESSSEPNSETSAPPESNPDSDPEGTNPDAGLHPPDTEIQPGDEETLPPGSGSLPETGTATVPENTAQPSTSSFDDLINRLTEEMQYQSFGLP